MVKGVAAVWLPVTDMQRAVSFYGDTLGLSVTEHDSDWSEVDANGVKIGLNSSESPAGDGGAAIAFQPEGDIEAEVDRLKVPVWSSRKKSPSTRGAGSSRSRTPTATTCSCTRRPPDHRADILITGASSGIGAATALHLDQLGMQVFAGLEPADQGEDALAGASSRLRRVTLDVTSDRSIAAAFEEIARVLGNAGLDGVVNNAGVGFPGPLEMLPPADLQRQLDVNVIGQVAVTQAALPLIRRGRGRIVFVGSIGGVLASQFAGAYHASKFALEAIGDVWRQELDPESIPVILVEPSTISTPIWEKAIAYLDDLVGSESVRLAPYRDRLHVFRERLHSADEHGKPAADVAEVIAKTLTEEHPDTRYVVGAGGRLATALRPLIPDRLADRLAERASS